MYSKSFLLKKWKSNFGSKCNIAAKYYVLLIADIIIFYCFTSSKDYLPHTNVTAWVQFETSDTGHVLDILKQVSVERLGTVRLHTVWLLALKNMIR